MISVLCADRALGQYCHNFKTDILPIAINDMQRTETVVKAKKAVTSTVTFNSSKQLLPFGFTKQKIEKGDQGKV